MTPRVVLDTNVLVAALTARHSKAAEVLVLWRAGRFEAVVSDATLSEARLVLASGWLERMGRGEEVESLLQELQSRGIRVSPWPIDDLGLRDAGDLRLVEAALAGEADYLVTADAEVLAARGYGPTRFVTTGELISILSER
ncbi:MAG: putative toxin-antitoxin system toxin component, PIN family [Dehalococcoidia bacterium]|nr:putative toxin-antitoxin system toxin component, PIN family [Dehalococcoidia bacterium]